MFDSASIEVGQVIVMLIPTLSDTVSKEFEMTQSKLVIVNKFPFKV
jgi:hypothetical protein